MDFISALKCCFGAARCDLKSTDLECVRGGRDSHPEADGRHGACFVYKAK